MFAGPLGRSTFTPPKSSFDSPLYGLVSLRRSHHFPLVKVMGRDTLPAIEIVRKFAAEHERESPELSFVAFLDADPEEGRARFAGLSEFIASADRPGAFNE